MTKCLPRTGDQVPRLESTCPLNSDKFFNATIYIRAIELSWIILDEWLKMARYPGFNNLQVADVSDDDMLQRVGGFLPVRVGFIEAEILGREEPQAKQAGQFAYG